MPFFALGLLALLLFAGGPAKAVTRQQVLPPAPPQPRRLPTTTPSGAPPKPAAAAPPTPAGAPPILANGTLGHTGQPAGMFWGLPMSIIWAVDNAYAGGDPIAMLAAAGQVNRYPNFSGLAGLIRMDAKSRNDAVLAQQAGA